MNKLTWLAPSNIALVKYWGKHGDQLPNNPSLSITLSKCNTKTSVEFEEVGSFSFEFYFENERNVNFKKRISAYFEKIKEYVPCLKGLRLMIYSENTFPHSAGIASSASALSALSMCICDLERQLMGSVRGGGTFEQKASFLARLGSGSASRSVYGGYVGWGLSGYPNSSDNHAFKLSGIHDFFSEMQDAILIINSNTKKVSSSLGHNMMITHPFAEVKYRQARENWARLKESLTEGNYLAFIRIVEEEALALHAMMMTSSPSYMLMDPNTVRVINLIREFREQTGLPICFSLDAGPNIHLLYPLACKPQVISFIEGELKKFCENGRWVDDSIGEGPLKLLAV